MILFIKNNIYSNLTIHPVKKTKKTQSAFVIVLDLKSVSGYPDKKRASEEKSFCDTQPTHVDVDD